MRWIDLDGIDAPDDDLRHRGNRAGARRFARGEGIHWGDGELFFCCTPDTVANRLIGVMPSGATYVIGALRAQTELAGACFSPDGRTLYVNAYSPARTLAITGPWQNVA